MSLRLFCRLREVYNAPLAGLLIALAIFGPVRPALGQDAGPVVTPPPEPLAALTIDATIDGAWTRTPSRIGYAGEAEVALCERLADDAAPEHAALVAAAIAFYRAARPMDAGAVTVDCTGWRTVPIKRTSTPAPFGAAPSPVPGAEP